MKFNEYLLNESLNKVLPYRIKKDTIDAFAASFKINDKEYIFVAEQFEYEEANTTTLAWDVVFYLASKGKDFGMDIEITGTGDQFAVFATVVDIFKKFIQEKDPKMFMFNAEMQSRIRLYDRFAKEISKRFGYILTTSVYGKAKDYTFTKEYK